MAMLIKFGDYNNNYKYLALLIIFNYFSINVNEGILSQYLFPDQTEDTNNDNETKPDNDYFNQSLFSNETEDNDYSYYSRPSYIYEHPYIIDSINYLGIFIISIILHIIREKESGINEQGEENIIKANDSENNLIPKTIKQKLIKNNSFLKLVLILSYWVLLDHITRIIQFLMIFDYWMLELLFISLITSKLLNTEIYIHQKLGIIINSISCLILGIIRFIIIDNYYEGADDSPFFYTKNKWFIPISIIIYLFIVNSISYIYTELKFYMDSKFISHTKLLILYGLIGFILNSIACSIETSFKCVGENRDFFCQIYISNNETEEYDYDSYVENIHIFFEDFSGLPKKEFIIEIFLFLLGIILYYCCRYFEILIIKYLSPMHFIFSSLIYLFFIGLIELIINNTSENDNIDDVLFQNKISILNIIIDIFPLIGLMIYLEIIELNFCKLNYNLRKYIYDRSIKEINEDNDSRSINEDRLSRNSSIEKNVELPIKEEE